MSLDAKHAAAQAASGSNDVAASLTIAAGAVAIAAWYTGVGAGVSAILGVGSGIAWLIANEYADLAADPPRNDYHIVTKYKSIGHFKLPIANNNIEAVLNEFIRSQANAANAISALITSIERLDGARIDLRNSNANSQIIGYRIMKQRDAIKHNASIANKEIEYLINIRDKINFYWHQILQLIKSTNIKYNKEIDKISTIDDTKQILGNVIKNSTKLEKSITFLNQNLHATNNALPDILLDDKWLKCMQNMKKQLSVFVGLRFLDQKKLKQMYY